MTYMLRKNNDVEKLYFQVSGSSVRQFCPIAPKPSSVTSNPVANKINSTPNTASMISSLVKTPSAMVTVPTCNVSAISASSNYMTMN